VDRNAVNILFLDQWDYLRALFENRGVWAFFNAQHGPHREGLAVLVTTIIYRVTAWNVRAEAFAIVVVMVIASLAALGGPHVTANDAYDCDTAFKIYPNPAATHLKEKLDWLEGRHFNLFK